MNDNRANDPFILSSEFRCFMDETISVNDPKTIQREEAKYRDQLYQDGYIAGYKACLNTHTSKAKKQAGEIRGKSLGKSPLHCNEIKLMADVIIFCVAVSMLGFVISHVIVNFGYLASLKPNTFLPFYMKVILPTGVIAIYTICILMGYPKTQINKKS